MTFACYPIQLSKNRHPWKGRQGCQTVPSVSSEMFPILAVAGTISFDPDTASYSCGMLEKIGTASWNCRDREV